MLNRRTDKRKHETRGRKWAKRKHETRGRKWAFLGLKMAILGTPNDVNPVEEVETLRFQSNRPKQKKMFKLHEKYWLAFYQSRVVIRKLPVSAQRRCACSPAAARALELPLLLVFKWERNNLHNSRSARIIWHVFSE